MIVGAKDQPGLIQIAKSQCERFKSILRQGIIRADTHLVEPLAEELAVICGVKPEAIDNISHRQFEKLIASLFRNHGFEVELTSSTRDGGYDIIAASNPKLPSGTIVK